MVEKQRVIQEYVPGKQVTMAHIIPNPQGDIHERLGYRLVKEGTAITTIQEILGHESIMTTNLYTVTTEQDKVEALEALEW